MLEGFVPVIAASELPPGAMGWSSSIASACSSRTSAGSFDALRDVCGHAGAPLSTGTLAGYVIECPLHYACFDVRTGELLSGPVSGDVPTYQVHVDGDTVYVKK